MALSLAQLEAAETALLTALSTGTKSVGYGDKQVTYQDAASMYQALALIQGQIAALAGTTTGRSTIASTTRA